MYAPSETTSGSVASVALDDGLETATGRETAMKAIVQERYGTPDDLELREVDQPVVGDDEVLVRVRAASTIHVDRHRVVNGEPVTFSGRLRSGLVPSGGKLVELQFFDRGEWHTFRTTRAVSSPRPPYQSAVRRRYASISLFYSARELRTLNVFTRRSKSGRPAS